MVFLPSFWCTATRQKFSPSANISINDSTAWQCWMPHYFVICWKIGKRTIFSSYASALKGNQMVASYKFYGQPAVNFTIKVRWRCKESKLHCFTLKDWTKTVFFNDINTGKTLPKNCRNLSTSLKCFACIYYHWKYIFRGFTKYFRNMSQQFFLNHFITFGATWCTLG